MAQLRPVDPARPPFYFTEGVPDCDRLYANAKQLYSGYGVYVDRVSGIRRVPVLRLTPA